MDLAAIHHHLQVRDDEIHGLSLPAKTGVADVSLDPLDDGGFEMHEDTSDHKHG